MGIASEIIITAMTVLGTAGIWRFLETRLRVRAEQIKTERSESDGVQYRDDLKNRVRNMEALLAASAEEKDELRQQVLLLTEEVSALRTKVEYLEKENELLKMK